MGGARNYRGRMTLPTPVGHTWLVCAAAPAEARAILEGLGAPGSSVAADASRAWAPMHASDHVELLLTGVGKAAAAGALAHVLDPARHAGVLVLGVAGALPGSGLDPGAVVGATESVYADEGVAIPGGFTDLAAMGFAPGPDGSMGVANDPRIGDLLAEEGLAPTRARVATVSTCSGTDAYAKQVVARTGAVAEAMEGAAVGFVVQRLAPELPFAEVRVVSNTTGERPDQRWDLEGALRVLRRIAGVL